MAACPFLVTTRAKARPSGSRRAMGPPGLARTSRARPFSISVEMNFWAAAPLSRFETLITPSSRCEAAERATSWVSLKRTAEEAFVVFDMDASWRFAGALSRRHHRDPAEALASQGPKKR